MASVLAQKTLVGTVGSIYELRSVGAKKTSVLDFSVAITPRKKTGDNEWADGITNWQTVTVWNKLADNVSTSLKKGDRVIVHGREDMKDGYTNKEGIEVAPKPIVIADYVGIELSYNGAESHREPSASRRSAPAQSSPSPAPITEPKSATTNDADDFFGDDDFKFESDGEVSF
jgi:single-strand DNA-binding protein